MPLTHLKENLLASLADAYCAMNLHRHNEVQHNGYIIITDPLQLSPRTSLQFPKKAATRLAQKRSERYERYDNSLLIQENAEQHVHRLASIMGMLPPNDLPSAA